MKKIILVGIVTVVMSATSWAGLSWTYGGDLLTFDAAIQTGWLVQMYQDVNGDSNLGSISAFDTLGTATGTGVADDGLLAFTTSLTVDKGGAVIWGDTVGWSEALYGENVYSVIFNASSISSATQAVVVDASPFTLPIADPGDYQQLSVNNAWVPVPEPASVMLLALGGGLTWLFRMRQRLAA